MTGPMKDLERFNRAVVPMSEPVVEHVERTEQYVFDLLRGGSAARMIAQSLTIFPDDEGDYHQIENGQHDEARRWREGISVHLISDKQAKRDYGQREGPQSAGEKCPDNEQFHYAVAKKVPCVEGLVIC